MNRAPDDDEANRTTIRPAAPATRTGRTPADAQNSSMFGHTLVEGTRLGEFEVTGLIGEGGFGIVYLAWDSSLMRDVAIKEYMPSSLATRGQGTDAVIVKAERHAETFRAGLKSFVNEARLLARFDHASLLKVYRFWEANGTAYMAMPYYRGPTLKATLSSMSEPPDQARLMSWLRPLLDAMAVLHNANCFHRDIAPDNILLTTSGPLLLDFGAARRVIGDMTHALTVVLKPGFAPIEQYGDVSTMAQGAWTDLYALASVVYAAITGKPPVSSVERLMADTMAPLAQVAAGRYSERFLRAVDAALAVRPQDRTQSVAQFWELLDADNPRHAPLPAVLSQAAVDSEFQALTHPSLHEPRQAPTGMLHAPTGVTRHAPPATGLQPGQPTGLPTQRATGHSLPAPSASNPSNAPAAPPMDVRFTQVPIRTELRHKPAAATAAGATPGGATAPMNTTAIRQASAGLLRTGVTRAATSPVPAAPSPPAAAPASKTSLYVIAAVVLLLVIGAALFLMRTRSPTAQPATPAATPAASAVLPGPAPTTAPVPAPAPAPVPDPSPPATTAAPAPVVNPPAAPAAQPYKPAKPAPSATEKPDKPARPAPIKTPVADAPAPRPAVRNAATRARCSDILTKGSLEPLSADETAFLKQECR